MGYENSHFINCLSYASAASFIKENMAKPLLLSVHLDVNDNTVTKMKTPENSELICHETILIFEV